MFDTKTVETEIGGKTLKLETGRVARQADGAVLATMGETVVLCAVTAAKSVKPGQDFFPLTVHYQEKFSAAGRIPGGVPHERRLRGGGAGRVPRRDDPAPGPVERAAGAETGRLAAYVFRSCSRLISPSTPPVRTMVSNSLR